MALENPIFFYQDNVQEKNAPDAFLPMLDYLQNLDPVSLKYSVRGSLSAKGRAIAAEFETQYQYSSITKQKYSGILDNLRLVYGRSELVKNDITAFHMVEMKLLCGYFGLPQLNQMFDEDYFNFEWDMHVGQNYSEHRSDYYRDHFIHQIRDLYMILRLLREANFYEASEHILRDPSASKVSNFVYKNNQLFKSDTMGVQQQLLKKLFTELDSQSDEETYIESFFFKYVIFSASMLAALFHDMGYPICHFLDVRRRISAYNPTMYMFTHNAVESFDQLAFKLGSSLLFSVVSPHWVRKRLEPNKDGRYDHGAYSAIAFLLQFYDSGVIHNLSAEKQCAIELAALAIFNHTSKFKALKPKADSSYYNMYFQQNPVSFLLRFCDDLQEWDRRYFEISNTGDLLFCPTCGFPMLKHKLYDEEGYSLPKSRYDCFCKNKLDGLFRPDVFIKRKLYLVSVADWVKLSLSISESRTPDLIAKINYDPYKLLMLAKTNPTYAKYRASELKELKRLLADQDFSFMSQGELPFLHIYLDYFMTANPILIKIKILENYLSTFDCWDSSCPKRDQPLSKQELFINLTTSRSKTAQKAFLKNLRESVFPNSSGKEALSVFLKGKSGKKGALDFYYYLLRDCLSAYEKRSDALSMEVFSYLLPFKDRDPQYFEIMSGLIRDCMKQYKKTGRETSAYLDDDEEESFYQYVESYTDDHNYFNHFKAMSADGTPYIGYFNDIFFFYRMNDSCPPPSE